MPLLNTPKKTTRPRLEDDERVVEARATLDRLKAGLTKAAAKEEEANARLRQKAPTTEARARQLISGEATESDGIDWQVERRKAFESREVHERAVKDHSNTLRLVERQRSQEICAAVEPEFRTLVQDVIETIGAALAGEGRVRNFIGILENEGVVGAHGFLPTEPLAVEQLTAWLARARAQGYDA